MEPFPGTLVDLHRQKLPAAFLLRRQIVAGRRHLLPFQVGGIEKFHDRELTLPRIALRQLIRQCLFLLSRTDPCAAVTVRHGPPPPPLKVPGLYTPLESAIFCAIPPARYPWGGTVRFSSPCPSPAAFPPSALPRRDLGMARLAERHQVPLGMGAAFRQRPDMVYFLGGRHLPRLPAFLA